MSLLSRAWPIWNTYRVRSVLSMRALKVDSPVCFFFFFFFLITIKTKCLRALPVEYALTF